MKANHFEPALRPNHWRSVPDPAVILCLNRVSFICSYPFMCHEVSHHILEYPFIKSFRSHHLEWSAMHHGLLTYRGCFALLGFQARRNILSLVQTWKLILVLFLFFALLLQPKATQCGILTARSNHDARWRSRQFLMSNRAYLWKMIKKSISLGEVFFVFQKLQ